MKKIILILALVFFYKATIAQQLQTLQIGYQEPLTTILDFTSDPDGNIYYMGYFKGVLSINDVDIAQGKGGYDLFLAKTDNAGNLIWHKCFGGVYNDRAVVSGDMSSPKTILYKNGSLHVLWSGLGLNAEMGPFVNTNTFASLFGSYSSNDGSLEWYHKLDCKVDELLDRGDSWYITVRNTGAGGGLSSINYDNLEIANGMPSGNVLPYVVNLVIKTDSTGSFSWAKKIYQENGSSIKKYIIFNKQLFFFLTHYNSGDIHVGDTTLPAVPSGSLLFKADQSFKTISKIKIDDADYTSANIIADNDSLYILHKTSINNNGIFYEANKLNIIDTGLVLIKSELLTSNNQFIDNSNYDNSVSLANFSLKNGIMYCYATFTGVNNTGLPDDSVKMGEFSLFKNHKKTVNLLGTSKSYVVKYNLYTGEISSSELGNKAYSNIVNSFSESKYKFICSNESVWNPWIINENLTIEKGKIRPGADQADDIRMIKYLSDGSRMVLGLANGRTNLDPPGEAPAGNLFFARIGKNNEVIWYKRPVATMSTYPSSILSCKQIGDKLFVFVRYANSTNGSLPDYIKLDGSKVTGSNFYLHVLFSLDKDGKIQMYDLSNILFGERSNQGGGIYSLDIIDENTALVSSAYLSASPLQIGSKSFPSDQGTYIAKLDLNSLQLTDAIKIIPETKGTGYFENTLFSKIEYDFLLNEFVYYTPLVSNVVAVSPLTFKIHNGYDFLSKNIIFKGTGTGSSSRYAAFLRGNFDGVSWAAQVGPFSQQQTLFALINSKIAFLNTGGSSSIYYNGSTLIHDGTTTSFTGLIDKTGNLTYWKNWITTEALSLTNYRVENINSQFYASGYISKPLTIDTLQISTVAGINDGVTIQFDSTLKCRKIYHLSSPLTDRMNGFDIYKDSLISFVYASQSNPVLIEPVTVQSGVAKSMNFISGQKSVESVTISPEDKQPDAWMGQAVIACTKTRWYKDSDGDGFGDPLTWVDECLKPQGFVANNLDCNDAEPTIDPCPDPTTILKNEDNETINIFPNPANGKFQIEINGMASSGVSVKVYNSNGKEIFYKQLCPPGIFSIDLSNQKNGLYLLKVVNGKQQIVKKVVLQN